MDAFLVSLVFALWYALIDGSVSMLVAYWRVLTLSAAYVFSPEAS